MKPSAGPQPLVRVSDTLATAEAWLLAHSDLQHVERVRAVIDALVELARSFRRPSACPRNSVPAAKISLLGLERAWGTRLIEAAMRANFADDRDIASPAVLDEILGDLGLHAAETREEAASPAQSPALRRSTEEAATRAPLVVRHGELSARAAR